VSSRRPPIPRTLATRPQAGTGHAPQPARHDAARLVRHTLIDFSSLPLPADVRLALAQAFWGHIGGHSDRSIASYWKSILPFARFAAESQSLRSVADLDRAMLVRYIEWLNAQRCADGRIWALTTQAAVYGALRQLLRWLERCRPDLITSIDYPFSPFPNKAAARASRSTLSGRQLRAILQACEDEIAQMRTARESAARQRAADADKPGTLGWILEQIDQRHGGIIPDWRTTQASGNFWLQKAVRRYGGAKQLAPLLYPRAVSLLPYYLAILIHTAGNPEAIADLTRDCLQPLPLLDDRELLVWFKARASRIQRRTFDRADAFGPPALVRDILAWNERLIPLTPPPQRNRLFVFKGQFTVNAMSIITVHHQLGAFCDRHGLPHFAPANIRPSVLSCFYRASGDLLRTKAVANHASVATTVRYVQTPLVEAQNRSRIADLQGAFIEHIEGRSGPSQTRCDAAP